MKTCADVDLDLLTKTESDVNDFSANYWCELLHLQD